jgi:uncharacterized membrane protein
VSALVEPGSSAIFILAQSRNLRAVLHQMHSSGGTVIYLTLSSVQEDKVQQALTGG